MRAFDYQRAMDLSQAATLGVGCGQGQVDAEGQFLAGGTTVVDLMKLDVMRPQRVIDLNELARLHRQVESTAAGLRLGAFATMAEVGDHPAVNVHYPVIAQSLQQAASPQLRNMATLGGNVLQRTRCAYYRDTSWPNCNKRVPGSGCAALGGYNRNHAILGVDEFCIAQYPGDLAVALIALDTRIELSGPRGRRRMPFDQLHRPSGQPHLETTLLPGETILGFDVAPSPWNARSAYIKVRDRASYEFAIASVAVALDLQGERVRQVRIGLGGMAYRPWRAKSAEDFLTGKVLSEANAASAADVALAEARTHGHNDYKVPLGKRAIVRALLQVKGLPSDGNGAPA